MCRTHIVMSCFIGGFALSCVCAIVVYLSSQQTCTQFSRRKLKKHPPQKKIDSFPCGKDYSRYINSSNTWTAMNENHPLPEAIKSGWRAVPGGAFTADGCSLYWYTQEEACEIVASVGTLFIQGDSLMRQLLIGLMAVLSNNVRVGGIVQNCNQSLLFGCDCERQFQCYRSPVSFRFNDGKGNIDHKQPQFLMCPSWKKNHLDASFPTYGGSRKTSVNKGQAVYVTDFQALHHAFKSPEEEIMSYLVDLEGRNGNAGYARGSLIPMTVHWPGPNKPPKFSREQGEENVERYNSFLRNLSTSNGLWLLESYAFTKGEYSRDGVHYDDANIPLAQILLNYLGRSQEAGRIRVVREQSENEDEKFVETSPEYAYEQVGLSVRVHHGPYSLDHFIRGP